jgi:hypothetical protein
MAVAGFAQDSKIEISAFGDKYSKYVEQLEDGDLNIDYADFRHSFLDRKQYHRNGTNYDSLKNQVYTAIEKENHKE